MNICFVLVLQAAVFSILTRLEVNFTNKVTENYYVVQMIFVMLHDLEFNVVGLLRQQLELFEVRVARAKLVLGVVAVLSCNIINVNHLADHWSNVMLSFDCCV